MLNKTCRLVLLMIAAAMVMGCLSGCFTFSFPAMGGGNSEKETTGSSLFNPDGDDNPLSDVGDNTLPATQPSTEPEASVMPTEKETEPVKETEKPTEEPTQAPTEKPTEPPVQQPTQPPVDPLPANPIAYGIVTGEGLNVRRGPGTNYASDSQLSKNTRIAIYEREGDWGRTKDGWVSLKYVYIDGTVGPDGSVMGTVEGMSVRIRTGPGTQYNVYTVVDTGDRLEILFRVTLGDMEWGCTKLGWISMDYVIVDGE